MKKKIWIPIAVAALLAVLFVPLPQSAYDDGGTREYTALTYKIVAWNRLCADGVYDKTRIYFGSDRNLSVETLWEKEIDRVPHSFFATVLEINGDSVTVSPLEGEEEQSSGDKISFSKKGLENIGADVGSVVEITYTGGIMESYPAQITATGWRTAENLRKSKYSGTELDESNAEEWQGETMGEFVITKIHSDCFFAVPAYSGEYSIRLKGVLSDEWCIGDGVICAFENAYYDEKNNLVQADLVSIDEVEIDNEGVLVFKPVIYLYPEKKTEVSVKLSLHGALTCTYPRYDNGWTVTAFPDGTLIDSMGKTYNYLYWEGETDARYDLSEGFCVRGEDTAAFLEGALKKLGLTRREANEFIVYWLPLMEKNPYNIISFQRDVYTEAAALSVTPQPDTLLRVFMAWQGSDAYIELSEQELTAPERVGFTVVEWGGAEVPEVSG